MGIFLLPKNMQMVQGFPVNRSYTKAESDALFTGTRKETPTGTVNGVNTTFTVSHVPKFVVIDRMFSEDGYGYTLSGTGPYTIETDPLAPPVQKITSFY